jgi:hypothetical protein
LLASLASIVIIATSPNEGGPGRLRRTVSMAGGISDTSIAALRGIGEVHRTDE